MIFAAALIVVAAFQSEGQAVRSAAFEVAAIKLANPNGGPMGVYTYPGGKIFAGQATLKMLVEQAFNLRPFQVSGGPSWGDGIRYDITALPPDSSPVRHLNPVSRNSPMSVEQREMLKSLLIDRFKLRFHTETKDRPVYVLTRGKGKLQMSAPKDTASLPYLLSLIQGDGTVNGAMIGNNISMELLCQRLSKYLERIVIDKTGLPGSYDINLPAVDNTNRDVTTVIVEDISRLGLKLEGGKGPVTTLVIDSAEQPALE